MFEMGDTFYTAGEYIVIISEKTEFNRTYFNILKINHKGYTIYSEIQSQHLKWDIEQERVFIMNEKQKRNIFKIIFLD